MTSILGLAGAIPILLGDNIGTTITALLASIGQSKDAKRTAVAHCIFNISGCFLFIWFVKPFAALIQYISPKGPEIEVISRQIANAHTVFNITMTLIWVCLINVMVKIVMTLIPDGKSKEIDPARPLYLDEKIINQPTAALQLGCKRDSSFKRYGERSSERYDFHCKDGRDQPYECTYRKRASDQDTGRPDHRISCPALSSGTMTEQQASQTAV